MQPLLRRAPPFVLIGLMTLVVSLHGIADTTERRARPFPDLIPLPADFGSEGIAVGRGHRFYVGSFTAPMLGQILVGDLRTGTLEELVPPTGMMAVGMKVDRRTNFLYVAGGTSGSGRIYDARSGAEIASYQFQPPGMNGLNDVVVTHRAAYFTDTNRPFLYRIALSRHGDPQDGAVIPLPPNFGVRGGCTVGPGPRGNGIAATPNGKYLLQIHMSEGQLYRTDTRTLTPVPIVLTGGDFAGGAPVCSGDGLLLDGLTLYIGQFTLNRVAVVKLSPDLLSGVVTGYITEPFQSNPATKLPTTLAEFGNRLYAVTYGGAPPSPDFVVRLPK
jgi:hypothetical protein